jgi:Cft2 family RNA processing exonuclease
LNISFLGGASGVGASCLAIDLAGERLLVDAGVRMDPTADRLPDLAALDNRPPRAIFVTHAHADHIGALPLVHQHAPLVPLYASPATIRLIEVMLADALRVMERRVADELEIPLYDAALVASLLRMLRPLPLGEHTVPELPGVTIHVSRAGHVAGAVGFGFAAPDGRLVVSGDVSMTPQRTVLGAAVPTLRFPDLLVLESTYGARLHPNRQAEELRLARAVADGVARGHVLIPAFALGRAQEVLLILRAAQRDGAIPEFPIYVDGLVRTVCAAYAGFPDALAPALRNHVLRGGKPFLSGTARAVDTPAQRERILDGPACCIIASSGMLTGGPSAFYATRLLERPEASILITGYQDEEAPGRRLLAAAAAPPGTATLTIEGRTLPVRCQVAQYSLSAHADGAELAGLVSALKPRAVALVHGDPEARAALAARLRGQTEALLPRDGVVLVIRQAPGRRAGRGEPQPRRPTSDAEAGGQVERVYGIGEGAELDLAGLDRLWQALGDGTGTQTFSLRELAHAWHGPTLSAEAEVQTDAALAGPQSFFAPLPGVPGVWRLLATTEVRRAQAAGARRTGRSGPRPDQAGILATVDRLLADAPDLYRRSIDADTGAVTLGFYFPDIAVQRHAVAIAAIAAETGVSVMVSPQPHQGMLARAALEVLPQGLVPQRAPAIHLEERTVRIRCEGQATPAQLAESQAAFADKTGWRLDLFVPTAPADQPVATFTPNTSAERMEYNTALFATRELFGPETGCYKIGADQQLGVITLRFTFPDVARDRYARQVAELADGTGWQVQIHPQPHQAALAEAARQALPPGVTPLGSPSFNAGTHEVLIRCRGEVAAETLAAAQETFLAQTGWRLVVRL